MTDKQIHANGITLRCRVEGPPSAPSIILSNSLATDLAMWDGQAGRLSRSYQVIRYDARGHGESEASRPPYTLSTLVEDVRCLLDALGVEKAHYVGLSLGGMVGQMFAAHYPQRLLSLSLCDTSAIMNRAIWDERIELAQRLGIAPVVEPSLERWFTKKFRDSNSTVIEGFRQMIARTSLDGYLGSGSAIRDMNNIELLSQISTPTLIVVGRQDPSTPTSAAEQLHSKIANSSLVIIEEAAHLPNIEQARQFNEVLEEFLARQSGTLRAHS